MAYSPLLDASIGDFTSTFRFCWLSVSYMVLHCNGKLMHENELEK